MSEATLQVLTGGKKTYHSVEVARKQEATSWEMADAIQEDYVASIPQGTDVNQVKGEILDEIAAALQKEGFDYKRSTVKTFRQTSEAWPPSERVTGASFTAHKMLRGKAHPNRRASLERLRDRSKSGVITGHQVEVWLSEHKPPASKTFLQLVEERVRASLKAAAQPWHTVSDGDRSSIARILRVMAEEVDAGEFPKRKA